MAAAKKQSNRRGTAKTASGRKNTRKKQTRKHFPLEESAHKRTFYIVYSKNRILKPHVRQFIRFVQDFYRTY